MLSCISCSGDDDVGPFSIVVIIGAAGGLALLVAICLIAVIIMTVILRRQRRSKYDVPGMYTTYFHAFSVCMYSVHNYITTCTRLVLAYN